MPYYTIKDLNNFCHIKAQKIARKQGTKRQPHPAYKDITHPTCITPSCVNPKIVHNWHWTSGNPVYRPVCQKCHDINTAEKYAVKTGAAWVRNVSDVVAHKAGYKSITEYLNAKAQKDGYTSLTEYRNTTHPYRKYRKDFCENVDGRLGFVCTTTIVWEGQLDVDHKDENPKNNKQSNLQTLCKCCHVVKGNHFIKENGVTPGRKTLGITRR
jgi:5-methylcytosine-specific restriction endonuclease McrA